MEEIRLRGKQKLFCVNYLANGLNATKAYLDAGYKVKSEAAAQSASSRLLSNDMVQAYVEQQLKIMEDEKIAQTTEILQTLTRILRREETEEQAVLTKNPTTITMTSAEGELYDKFAYEEVIETVELKTKNTDVVRAGEMLGKYYGMWTDKVDIDGDMSIEVIVDYGDQE